MVVILQFKMPAMYSVKMIFSVCMKAVMCPRENMRVNKLCSGMSYTAIGHEFNINE